MFNIYFLFLIIINDVRNNIILYNYFDLRQKILDLFGMCNFFFFLKRKLQNI